MANVLFLGCGSGPWVEGLVSAGHSIEHTSLSGAGAEFLGSPQADVIFCSAGAAELVPLVRRLALEAPASAVVAVVPPRDVSLAEGVLDAGATDVAVEPLRLESALVLVSRALRDARAKARNRYLQGRTAHGAESRRVSGESLAVRQLVDSLTRLARRSSVGPSVRILFTGETGTGKNLFARMVHFAGARRDQPFVEVNCASLPGTLIEAELFGYERGAFTDARAARAGLFEAAHGGTLFLDEISALSLEAQAKLLTALESGRVRRLGTSTDRVLDVQVISATSQELSRLVEKGAFRSDLFHRLSAFSYHLPPLRERGQDAVLLAEQFTQEIATSYRLPMKELSEGARRAILAHRWPGNVRELFHAIERAMLGEERVTIEAEDLGLLPGGKVRVAAIAGGIEVAFPEEGLSLEAVERTLIERALEAAQGNVTRAAALLGLSRDTLRYRLEKFGISAAGDKAGQ